MMVRMFERQKWSYEEPLSGDHNIIPADTITSDLRTRSNTLSFWSINTPDELEDAVLAIATSRNQLTRLDVLILQEDKIVESNLELVLSPETGHSPYSLMNEKHYNLVNLNYNKLGDLSRIIISVVENDGVSHRYTKQQIREIIYSGHMNGKIEFDEMHEDLQKELTKFILSKSHLQ